MRETDAAAVRWHDPENAPRAAGHQPTDDIGQEELGWLALVVRCRLGVEGVEGAVELVEDGSVETPQVHAHLLLAAQALQVSGLGAGDREPSNTPPGRRCIRCSTIRVSKPSASVSQRPRVTGLSVMTVSRRW